MSQPIPAIIQLTCIHHNDKERQDIVGLNHCPVCNHQKINQLRIKLQNAPEREALTELQSFNNDLCRELCRIEDALGFRQDQHNLDGSWKPTIDAVLEKLRDYISHEAELQECIAADREALELAKEALEKSHASLAMNELLRQEALAAIRKVLP